MPDMDSQHRRQLRSAVEERIANGVGFDATAHAAAHAPSVPRTATNGAASDDKAPFRNSLPLFLTLIVAGLVGNHFRFPLFLNIDFLFGSIMAMLALQLFGIGRGVLAAGLITSYTYILWNHPYVIIIKMAEVAVVGWLMQRRKMGMVLADTLYWLVIGMPLVFVVFYLIMDLPLANTNIILVKQAANGIANALVARLLFTAFILRFRSPPIPLREVIYNLLAAFVLFPALIMLGIDSRTDAKETDLKIRRTLALHAQHTAQSLNEWTNNRRLAIANLADLAAERTAQQTQARLEQTARSDRNFLRIALVDSNAISTAFFPLRDELDQSNIGRNFSDRPFIPALRQTLQPMLSEVVMSRIGPPLPAVQMLAPLVIRDEYAGYVSGVLSLEQLRGKLDQVAQESAALYTLLDRKNNVIMSNRDDQTAMKPFTRAEGTLKRIDANLSQWLPLVSANISISEQWKDSVYIMEVGVGETAEWKLVLEQPVAPFQKALYERYASKLTLLLLILLGSLALAEFLSRRTVGTLDALSILSRDLDARLATGGKALAWPASNIKETRQLIANFRQMADSMTAQFATIQRNSASLERMVAQRTRELERSNQFKAAILDSMAEQIYVLNHEGVIVAANRAWQRFGLEDEAEQAAAGQPMGVGVNYFDICAGAGNSPASAQRALAGIRRVLEGRAANFSLEYECHSPDAERWFTLTVTPMNVAGAGAVVVHTDVTESIRSKRELVESEDRFKQFMNALPALAFIKDETGRLAFANRRMEEVIKTRAWPGQSTAELVPPKAVQPVLSDVSTDQRVMESGHSVREEEIPDVSGKRRIYQMHHFAISRQGRPPLVGGIALDITERKQADLDLLASRAEAEKANNAKSRFLAAASHDLRQPLSALSLYVGLLASQAGPAEARLVGNIQECADNLSELLTDLLDVSKLDAGVVVPKLAEFTVAELLESLVSIHAGAAADKGLRLRLRHGACATLRSDRQLLQRIVGNFVANAIRYTDRGGVLVACRRRQGKRWIEVWDSGKGIPAEQTAQIFEEFVQLGDDAARRGSGLGLAIAARTAGVLGLQIRVSSRPGRGSLFAIELPAETAALAPLPPLATPLAGALRVAVIDNDERILGALVAALEHLGHHVIAATSADALVAGLGGQAPDLLLSDYRLDAGATGFEAIARVRQALGRAVPAVLMTGDTDPALVRRFTDSGIPVHYKPLRMETLLAIIDEAAKEGRASHAGSSRELSLST